MEFKVNYPEAGATRAGPLPPGYRHLLRSVDLDAPFAEAAEVLMTWGLHERCGLHPESTADRAAPGVEVTLRFAGVLRIPCQVVWAEETPGRTGFGYGSMPGHPERGEAGFLLEAIDGRVRFSLRSFSVPGTTAARLGAPVARFLQSRATDHFMDTMRDACSSR
ncbi:DUF1990 family protein [Glycomyces algeriensis]|uniref:DUF1990 domain-containing protein n=1 Tax=Glycomyces algeriensis TaxID=256037 RepID=A0A9W6GD13_9ACTN|nr:DUF1990 domain-containing protein [Glycomyces algeriensis]MDA1368265.1 DUF1990 domain-containing protein [Glycomyces algeriensis]MDR7351905.1 uncharacterized protein (UPF0548 family) [Glycomyces algeriensis]GLI44635.1 DUF1990 domain-containing protein [Glycomyces algeriensis]